MIVIFGIIAVVAGSALIGYALGQRTVKRKRAAQAMRIFELETDQSAEGSVEPVADQGKLALVEPATDHQRAIAKTVDEKFTENPGNHQATIRDYLDISASVKFVMSAEDSQFLVDYLRWRLSNPIRASKSKGASA